MPKKVKQEEPEFVKLQKQILAQMNINNQKIEDAAVLLELVLKKLTK